MKSLKSHINESQENDYDLNDIIVFAKSHQLKVVKKSKDSVTLEKPNKETIKIDIVKDQTLYDGNELSFEELFDELAIARFDENLDYENISEGGILDIARSMGKGDLLEIVSALTNSKEFAKSSVKREVVNQLAKRKLIPKFVAKGADFYYKVKPIGMKILGL